MAAAKDGRKAPARKSVAEEQLPGIEDARAAFGPALSGALERPRAMLRALRVRPPQLLHLEGGEAADRVALALWWAALLNCEDPEGMEPKAMAMGPCLSCSSCLRLGVNMHPDLILLDSRLGTLPEQMRQKKKFQRSLNFSKILCVFSWSGARSPGAVCW